MIQMTARCAALAFLLAAPAAAEPAAYSLAAAVDAVMQRSPAMAAAKDRVWQADAALRETRMKRLPRLALNSAFTRGDNPVYVFGSLLEQRTFTQANFDLDSLNNPALLSNFKNSFEVGVPLFTGFELQSYERIGRFGRDAAASAQGLAAQDTRYEVVESFLQVLLQRELAAELAERIESSAAELESARKLRERGLVLGSDYYAAQATMGGLRAWRIKVESGLDAAKAKLATFLGISAQSLEVKGGLALTECRLEPESQWLQRALSQRPELRQASLQEDMAGALRRQEGFSLLPRVEAFGAMETDTRDFNGNPWNTMFGVRARLPLGDPAYLSRRAKAQASWEASRAESERIREGIAIELSQAYHGYGGVCASLPIVQDTAAKARQSLELFRPLYREGRQSIIEVLRAEEGMAKAQAAYLEDLYGLRAGKARLLLAAGGFDGGAVGDLEAGLGEGR